MGSVHSTNRTHFINKAIHDCEVQMDFYFLTAFSNFQTNNKMTKSLLLHSGNHERDFPNSGSFYDTRDSGGECGVPAQTMYYVPADNRAKFW